MGRKTLPDLPPLQQRPIRQYTVSLILTGREGRENKGFFSYISLSGFDFSVWLVLREKTILCRAFSTFSMFFRYVFTGP